MRRCLKTKKRKLWINPEVTDRLTKSVTGATQEHADELIQGGRSVTVQNVADVLNVLYASVQRIIANLRISQSFC